MKLAGCKINMFRCHIDPMIGPNPRNAFVPSSLDMEAFFAEDKPGIVVVHKGIYHFVGFTNIQSLRFTPPPEQKPQVNVPTMNGSQSVKGLKHG